MEKRLISRCMIIVLLLILTQALPVLAAEQRLTVAVNQSRIIAEEGVERVAVANPEIADVMVVSGEEILLVGKTPGVTTMHVWSASGRMTFQVEVGSDNVQIANDIKALLGYDDIRIRKVDKTVILEGVVNDQYQRSRAEKVAGAYAEKVVNLIEIAKPMQVKIEAKIIEIRRGDLNNLGLKWGNDPSNPGSFLFGQSYTNNYASNAFGKLGTYAAVNGVLDALVKKGSARILSQPNIITVSGEKANIQVGGQIPVPVAVNNNSITVEWKEYGIKLEISPEVSNGGLIRSTIKAEVSAIDWASEHQIGVSANLKIPPLTVRKAETVIAMNSGELMAIGGLISHDQTKDVRRIPYLSDLPIIGNLFKSTSFNRDETELVILITPTIVETTTYKPDLSSEMKEETEANPWGGKKDVKKD